MLTGVGDSGTRGVLPLSDPFVRDAVESMEMAFKSVAALDSGLLTDSDRRALLVRMETLTRAMYGTSHTWLTELVTHDGLAVMPERSNASRLANLLRVDPGVAGKRIKIAAKLSPRRALTGEQLDPIYPQMAAAHADGAVDAAHAAVVDEFFDQLPDTVDPDIRTHAERQLAALAKDLAPAQLRVAAGRLLALLDEDGTLGDDKDRARKCYIKFGRQGSDGLTPGTMLVDSEFRALIEAAQAKTAKPGHSKPEDETPDSTETGPGTPGSGPTLFDPDPDPDPDPDGAGGGSPLDDVDCSGRKRHDEPDDCTRDLRNQGERNHDALKAMLRQILASGNLGQHRGLPVTAIITMTLKDLEAASGHAITGTGSLVPIRDAIRMASHAHHYLTIFDDNGRALYLGRSKRLASADQRIVLIARDRGCTFPGCTRPATWCQAHHVDDWEEGGDTDVDALTLACDYHHPLVGSGPDKWATTTTGANHLYPGRTRWHPPATVDPTRRGLINHHHHPQEYLYQDPAPPDP